MQQHRFQAKVHKLRQGPPSKRPQLSAIYRKPGHYRSRRAGRPAFQSSSGKMEPDVQRKKTIFQITGSQHPGGNGLQSADQTQPPASNTMCQTTIFYEHFQSTG